MTYYTYIYLDPRLPGIWNTSIKDLYFEPFYVGKGNGNRCLQHKQKWSYSTKRSHKNHRIKNIIDAGFDPMVLIIQDNLSEEQALSMESLLIREIGTRSTIDGVLSGPLTNLKTDGVVQKYSEESRKKMSESATARVRTPHSEETKAKMRQSNRGKDPQVRKRMSENRKGINIPGQSERMSKLHKGKVISEYQKQRAKEFHTGRKASPESKRKMTESQLCHWRIEQEETEVIIFIEDLRTWCTTNNLNYQTFYGTMSRNKYHKGYKLLEKTYSPR